MEDNQKIYRSRDEVIFAGVSAGLAKYFRVDATLIRLIFIVLTLGGGSGLLIYLVMALIIPKEPESEEQTNKKTTKTMEIVKKENRENREETRERRWGWMGVVLILLGGISIWNQLMPIRIESEILWPVMLILAGVYILTK